MDGALLEEVRRMLAKKWTLALLRDAGLGGRTRFGHFLAGNPGLTARVLCRRLDELVDRGLLARTGSGKAVRYGLTPHGQAVLPIVQAICEYGARHVEAEATGPADLALAEAAPVSAAPAVP